MSKYSIHPVNVQESRFHGVADFEAQYKDDKVKLVGGLLDYGYGLQEIEQHFGIPIDEAAAIKRKHLFKNVTERLKERGL